MNTAAGNIVDGVGRRSRLDELRERRARLSTDPRAQKRRQLYREDSLWRLSKNKDNRERRLRAKEPVR